MVAWEPRTDQPDTPVYRPSDALGAARGIVNALLFMAFCIGCGLALWFLLNGWHW